MRFRSDLDSLILATLESGAMHGYDIAKAIRRRSEEVMKVGENMLYPALHRLEQEGLIAGEWQSQDPKPPKKLYSLTDRGAKKLTDRRKEWETFVAMIGRVLNPAPEGR